MQDLRAALALLSVLAAGTIACGRGDIESADPVRRAAAVRSLSSSGDRPLAVLLVAQRDGSPLVRAAAAERFAARGGPAAADALGKLLRDPASDVAAVAARGLAGMPAEPRARQHLLVAYADATPGARAAIADALDQIGVSLREAVEAEARILWERDVAALDAGRGSARAGAAEEIGASGRADAVQKLLPLVDPARTPDRALAAAAARGLGESGDWSARPFLEALVAEDDAGLAEAAAGALGRLGDPRAADALAAAGTAETARIAAAATEALAALPEAPEVGVALCELAIRAADPQVAARAAREARRRDAECPERPILAKLGRPGAEAALAALAELRLGGAAAQAASDRIIPALERAPEADVRAAAARALAVLGAATAGAAVDRRMQVVVARLAERRARWIAAVPAAGAPPEWIDPVTPDDAREAGALLAATGRLARPGAEPLLLAHARDPRPEVRAGALEGLAAAKGGAALEAVAAALADAEPAVRGAAAEGLARAGARGTPALVAAAQEAGGASPEWRVTLARALGDTGSAEAIPALVGLLDGPSAAAAAASLARIGAPAAAAPLAAYLARPEAPARPEVVEALAQLAAREAGPSIAALLTDDRPDVRAAAARALGRIRHEAASARLESLRSDYYGRVRRAAVEALAKFPSGVPRARR
ncbi:MAG TPA: HEAT repeat domain-containing protein [Anaeromyxobacter sp.]